MHQYYTNRIIDGKSAQTGLPHHDPMGRRAFKGLGLPADGNWYTCRSPSSATRPPWFLWFLLVLVLRYICMQKPFKRMPEFDRMLIAILKRDPLVSKHDCVCKGQRFRADQRYVCSPP
jgi:hypothetical protein